jgi:hypothetical protein
MLTLSAYRHINLADLVILLFLIRMELVESAPMPEQPLVGEWHVNMPGGGVVRLDDMPHIRGLLSGRAMSLHNKMVSVNVPGKYRPSGRKGLEAVHTFIMRECGFDMFMRQVHHVDGDQLNLKVSNLFAVTASEYSQLHKRPEGISEIMGAYRPPDLQAWMVRWKDSNDVVQLASFYDAAYDEDIKRSGKAADDFSKLKDEEERQRLLTDPPQSIVNLAAPPPPPPPMEETPLPSGNFGIKNIVLRRDQGIIEIELTDHHIMIATDTPEVIEVLRAHRFSAHKNHRTYYADTNVRDEVQSGPVTTYSTAKFHKLIGHLIPGEGIVMDHINGNGLDNRLENLRHVSKRVNKDNMPEPYKNSKTGVDGVHRVKKTHSYRASWIDDEHQEHSVGGFSVSKYKTKKAAKAAAMKRNIQERLKIAHYRQAYGLPPLPPPHVVPDAPMGEAPAAP